LRYKDTSLEWDGIAKERHIQIISGLDLSYHKVLIPTILEMLGGVRGLRILDVGCGSGVFSSKLATLGAAAVVGVDSSRQMIHIANQEYGGDSRIRFHHESIESFSNNYNGRRFDACVSNMSLVTMPNLEAVAEAVAAMLIPNGQFAFTITHPCFWNRYKKYESVSSFDYMREHAQHGRFTISLDKTSKHETTHFHRPLSQYVNTLGQSSLLMKEIWEPMPSFKVMKMYPHAWLFPRFLAAKALYVPGK